MPTASPPSPPRTPAAPQPRLAAKTLVRLAGKQGLFRVTSPAGWGGKDYTTPTHYNLVGDDNRILSTVPATTLTVVSTPPIEAHQNRKPCSKPMDALSDPLLLMLAEPEATFTMARRLLSRRDLEGKSIVELAKALLPRFFRTNCWRCGSLLDNLHDEACPKCEGLKCRCGGCRCNWPAKTNGILPVRQRVRIVPTTQP